MGVLSRIGIALDSDLLKRFDRSIGRRGYTNRSEAFRDLIRDRLVREQTAAPDATVVGTVTLIFNHYAHGITEKLTEAQHEQHDLVVSTSHAHLDHDSCLEVLIVHGKASKEIATVLGVSVNTVAVHRANIMQALGMHNTAELVVYAIREGLVSIA